MDDVISKLTAEQALKIVERLGRKGGKTREAVLTEAMKTPASTRCTSLSARVVQSGPNG
jgi:hypothetical protein